MDALQGIENRIRALLLERGFDEKTAEQVIRCAFSFSDSEIENSISYLRAPYTDLGKAIAKAVVRTAENNGDKTAPCRFKAFEKQLLDKKLEVWLISQKGKLCGPNFLDAIAVVDGNIITSKTKKERRFVDAFANYVAAVAEETAQEYELIRVGEIKNWQEANIFIPKFIQNFILANGKKIDVAGAVNLTAEIKFLR